MRTIVLSGGGIKSAVAARAVERAGERVLLHADFGQAAAAAERRAVEGLAGTLPETRVVPIELSHVGGLSKAWGIASPGRRGSSERTAGTPLPVNAARGLVFTLLSAGVQAAVQLGSRRVVIGLSRLVDGAHVGWPVPAGRPDGHREMLHALNIMLVAMRPAGDGVQVEAPLLDLCYAEIIKLGVHLGVSLEHTWSCGQSGSDPCGTCPRCRARSAAFVEARLVDPMAGAGVPAGR